MLYAVFMSRTLPPLPDPQDADGQPQLLAIGRPGEESGLRADAARNQAKVLEAAARLVAERGAAAVTMEAVATAACVGKGTVFRRFGDRNGLLMALLDHSATQLQADLMGGPPPLGPGAPPIERLRAFGLTVLRRTADQLDLQLAAQPEPSRRLAHPSHEVLALHVRHLLTQVVPDADCDVYAQTLMGCVDPAVVHHLTRRRGMPLERLEEGWLDLVARLAAAERPH
ncbi:TetR/AcrR family transcriptional regulator [Streptomyces sp. NPDC050085]|uniref:TetR/AcrR family transcriptional regulator n=1 Tax=Streptomyces sp. NPDC050085 TaxID=3365600 RepID=UPI00379EDB78